MGNKIIELWNNFAFGLSVRGVSSD